MAGLLAAGFVANLLVRPVNERFYMAEEAGAGGATPERPTAEAASPAWPVGVR